MDTAAFRQAFASADPALKSAADEVVKAVEANKLYEGAAGLANMAKSAARLTDEQKDAMYALGSGIQMVVSEDAARADLKVFQAIEDMVAALQGRTAVQVGTTPDREAPAVEQGN